MWPKHLLQWFKNNTIKVNTAKYHLLVINNKESFQIKIFNEKITSSKSEELLEVKLDHELNSSEHMSLLR